MLARHARHARPAFPGNLLGLAVPAGVIPPVDGDMPDAAEHLLYLAPLERGLFPAGAGQTTGPFFCAPSWDAAAASSIVRRCSNPLSCRAVSSQSIPLPCGATLAAAVKLRIVSTADSAARSSSGDNALKSKPMRPSLVRVSNIMPQSPPWRATPRLNSVLRGGLTDEARTAYV